MKITHSSVFQIVTVCALLTISVVQTADCNAQWGYFGRGANAPRGAFAYRGPLISFDVLPAYPTSSWAGSNDPTFARSTYGAAPGAYPYDRYRPYQGGAYAPQMFNQYRGIQPTQAELDRERFYDNLDRTHRYQTREDRYASDFNHAYASPSAMVNRYRYPYVAGTPTLPWTPEPIPGLLIGPHQSRYQGYVPDDDVAISLRAAANRLQRSLSGKADGHVWIRHLKPDQIIDAIDRGQHPAALADLVVNYEGIAQAPRLVLIAETEGFQDVRRLLSQYVTLQSAYPSAVEIDGGSWQPSSVVGLEVIVDEQVTGEQVFEQGFSADSGSLLESPSIPSASTPTPANSLQRSARPRLDSLPDEADVELLPAPSPTPSE